MGKRNGFLSDFGQDCFEAIRIAAIVLVILGWIAAIVLVILGLFWLVSKIF